jgi:ribosome assembly protein RRB1
MSKRSASDRTTDGQAFAKASGSGAKRDETDVNDIGEFEDAWEDEIESEDDVVDGEAEGDEDGA